ncbi:phosphoribosyltransferase [Egibacter rhizosphaerae]|uniref:Phosphoribosyltransferase n=1 Tax=Egibacter rhizosphaerae TaxID=1670831 RepID=A0A411YGJ0_9ACTN|nr:phosphoribosyltransferase family protein [Egibacter rhizosphaerae]QBI20296.1 phosphoribosyltransferase [Egibacter rhizosphaerae]
MEFRNLHDLQASVLEALPCLPRDIEVVVGVPRSGMLPATLIALYLNVPLADLDGWLDGRVLASGKRPLHSPVAHGDVRRSSRILIVDDSVGHGSQMRAVHERVAHAQIYNRIEYAAVYVTPECSHLVDYAFEEIPWGRFFAWNIMHHTALENVCVDIDGVICSDPSPDQPEGTPEYLAFLEHARPLVVPATEIGWLVTGRLEKYRGVTEAWLRRHGVRYRSLKMLNLPDVSTKRAHGGGAPFKARMYQETGATLFVESSERESAAIAKRTGRPVLCWDSQEMVYPEFADRLLTLPARAPRGLRNRLRRVRARRRR